LSREADRPTVELGPDADGGRYGRTVAKHYSISVVKSYSNAVV
jgi:hypothetical protein